MQSPAILLLFIGLSQASLFPENGTHCSEEYLPICGFRLSAGSRVVCPFFNMCYFDQFVLEAKHEWHVLSNEPCMWPTDDCDKELNEKLYRPYTTPPAPAPRKPKKHRKKIKSGLRTPKSNSSDIRRPLQERKLRELIEASTKAPIDYFFMPPTKPKVRHDGPIQRVNFNTNPKMRHGSPIRGVNITAGQRPPKIQEARLGRRSKK